MAKMWLTVYSSQSFLQVQTQRNSRRFHSWDHSLGHSVWLYKHNCPVLINAVGDCNVHILTAVIQASVPTHTYTVLPCALLLYEDFSLPFNVPEQLSLFDLRFKATWKLSLSLSLLCCFVFSQWWYVSPEPCACQASNLVLTYITS